jgi:hypothetical protein
MYGHVANKCYFGYHHCLQDLFSVDILVFQFVFQINEIVIQ